MSRNTHPTWEDAIRIGRELQEEHQIPLFAFTYYKMCSCCASPQDFRVRDFLRKKKGRDAYTNWDTFKALEEKPAYIVFANSSNYRGEIVVVFNVFMRHGCCHHVHILVAEYAHNDGT